MWGVAKGELLKRFLGKLRESVEKHPRRLFLVYAHSHFGKNTVLEERFTIVEDYPKEDITIYTYNP